MGSHFYCTLSRDQKVRFDSSLFNTLHNNRESVVIAHEKEKAALVTEDDLLVDLKSHNVPASLLTEFAEKMPLSLFRIL